MALQDKEKGALLDIARMAIASYIVDKRIPVVKREEASLNAKCGVFVSLHKERDLRGCIDVFTSEDPLYKTVAVMAASAAFEDPRFDSVTEDEVKDLDIEISILTPLKKIDDPNEIEIGRDGIYIIKGTHRGVLLPQVAVEHDFDRNMFLDHTCLKAGLKAGDWKEGAEIFTFEAEIFD
ncbi:MAG: AmmeMemoRadiSam system protein A, partial [Proteobacteria bacterium]|nr:AmmeMemoRadiSam system protein A [Pseudomonadota bacterium]